jgi:hypothetical protein
MIAQALLVPLMTIWALLHPAQAFAETLCRPQVTIKPVAFSQPANLRRYWTAAVDVDASACTAWSGLFALGFVRQSESAPDLEFAEPFIWRSEQTTVRVEFWADEAVGRYWIADIAPCACRRR